MAGLSSALRSSSSSSNLVMLLSSSSSPHSCFLLFLTILSLSLAAFAFLLQWRGGLSDPNRVGLNNLDLYGILGMGMSGAVKSSSSSGDCAYILGQSTEPSFPYFRGWNFSLGPGSGSDKGLKICITTSTSAGLEQILPWIFYHKVIGVTKFFLFVEGKAASNNVTRVLDSIPGVKLIFRTKELEEQQAKSRIWNETWLASFFYKPCNSELFVKQSLNMENAIVLAREAGMDWIFHLDTDELIHPAGTRHYSVQELLSQVPQDFDMVVFPNYESCVERVDIKDPFSEVSMFKKNYDHLPQEIYFGHYKEAARDNPNYFLTYGNGKSAARVLDDLRPNGAHRWYNYMKEPNETKFEEAAVLHYTYNKFSDLTSRRDRCGCKPTREDVKKCFMLEFDRDAFIIASTSSEGEMLQWYREHVAWTDPKAVSKLMRAGIFERIYAPKVIVQGLRESGLFTDVIASAWKKKAKQKESSSGTQAFFTRKFGFMSTQSTGRNILDLTGNNKSCAIPPQSPPHPDDDIQFPT